MNVEIEAKMRLIDRTAMQQKLTDLGAEMIAELIEINTYFDREGRLKSSDQGLRVRVERDNGSQIATITHKGPRAHGKLKSRVETEVGVDDPRHAADLLTALGFNPVLSFEKRRQRWRLDGCLVELDTLPYLGDFIEIEGDTDDVVNALRDRLGLADIPLIKPSYIAMLQTFLHENGIRANHITLEEAETIVPEVQA